MYCYPVSKLLKGSHIYPILPLKNLYQQALLQYFYHQLNFIKLSVLLQKDYFVWNHSFEKSSFSTRLKNTSKLACLLDVFHPDLGLKAAVSLKSLFSSFRKLHVHLILSENSSKSFLSSS